MKILEKYILPSMVIFITFAIGIILDYLFDNRLLIGISMMFILISLILEYVFECYWTNFNIEHMICSNIVKSCICYMIGSYVHVGHSEFLVIGCMSAIAIFIYPAVTIGSIIAQLIDNKITIKEIRINIKLLIVILVIEVLIISGILVGYSTNNYIQQKQYEALTYFDNSNVNGIEFVHVPEEIEEGLYGVVKIKVLTNDGRYDNVKISIGVSDPRVISFKTPEQNEDYYTVKIYAKKTGSAQFTVRCDETDISKSVKISVVPEE